MPAYNPDVHLWTIMNWSARNRPHGHEFKLWVSSRFLAVARKVPQGGELQQFASLTLRDAGIPGYEKKDLFHFGIEHGLEHFELPGEGGCSVNVEDFGNGSAIYRSHNVDRAEQQATLFALWLLWAQHVESYLFLNDTCAVINL